MKTYFTSTLFRKTLASLSVVFLVLFLAGHLAGNLQLFIPGEAGQKQFNEYAFFMTTNPVVNLLSIITYSAIILHVLLTFYLTIQSRNARPVKYAVSSGTTNSSWASNNMAVLGTLLLIFLVIHLRSFWYEMHFGSIEKDIWGKKDLYTVTVSAFHELWYVSIYVISMVVLGLHLKHGLESAFQTLGFRTRKYSSSIKAITTGLVLLIPITFASIPIFIYIKNI